MLDFMSDDLMSASETPKCVSECGDLFTPSECIVPSDQSRDAKSESYMDLAETNLVSNGGIGLRKPPKCRSACGDVPTCKKRAAASDSHYSAKGTDSYIDFADVDWMRNNGTRSRKVRKCHSVCGGTALSYACKQRSALDSDIEKEILLNFAKNNFESKDGICSASTRKSETCISLSPVRKKFDDSAVRQVLSEAVVVLPKLELIYKKEVPHPVLSECDEQGSENSSVSLTHVRSELSSESGCDDDNTHLPGTESVTRNEDESGTLAEDRLSAGCQEWLEATTCESLVAESNPIIKEDSKEEEDAEGLSEYSVDVREDATDENTEDFDGYRSVRNSESNYISNFATTSNEDSGQGWPESHALDPTETWSWSSVLMLAINCHFSVMFSLN